MHLAPLAVVVLAPLAVTEMHGTVNVKSTVKGGGNSGQIGALRLGVARALVDMRPELRPAFNVRRRRDDAEGEERVGGG